MHRSCALVVLPLAAACGALPGATGEACDAGPGDLVLTELMVDALGAEAAGEWVELYNPGPRPRRLARLGLTVQSTRLQRWELDEDGELAAGDWLVVGNAPAGGVVDRSYGSAISLDNGGAVVSLTCLGALVDSMAYGLDGGPPVPPAGHSLSLDGGRTPDATVNDAAGAWCVSSIPLDATSFGTPGGQNPACGPPACEAGGALRAVVAPATGELVVSEVFATTALGAIAGGSRDWLELQSVAGRLVDLNGVTLAVASAASGQGQSLLLGATACVSVAPGGRAVLAVSTDPALTGGVHADLAVPGLVLYNESPLVVSLAAGAVLVDRAAVPAVRAGRSASLDPRDLSAAGNDHESSFCASEAAGLFEERGTPGAPNVCGALCVEGGVQRAPRPPSVGDLVITELFPDATGADAGRDWIEVYASAEVDLQGLTIGYESPGNPPGTGTRGVWTVRGPAGGDADCLGAHAGEYVVVGGPAATALGVTPLAVFGGASDGLLPSNPAVAGDVRLRLSSGATVLDEVSYPQLDDPDPARRLVPGRSLALDERARTVTANDAPSAWCPARTRGAGFGDVAGTPGAPNPDACP